MERSRNGFFTNNKIDEVIFLHIYIIRVRFIRTLFFITYIIAGVIFIVLKDFSITIAFILSSLIPLTAVSFSVYRCSASATRKRMSLLSGLGQWSCIKNHQSKNCISKVRCFFCQVNLIQPNLNKTSDMLLSIRLTGKKYLGSTTSPLGALCL